MWAHQEFIPPSFYEINPKVIDLEYLNETEIVITEVYVNGTAKKAAFEPPNTPEGIMQRHLFVGQTYKFELISPENTSNMWLGVFDPDMIEMAKEVDDYNNIPLLQTKLNLSLQLPSNANYPQQDTVLKIKIIRTDISGNLWFPPKDHPYIGNTIFGKISWMLGALTVWGKYSGTAEETINNLSILVRVNKFHKPSFIPPKPIEISQNEVKSVLIEVENLGSHIDTFNFRVVTDSDSDIYLSAPPALTLEPGDKSTVSLGLSTPQLLRDPGSIHHVTIEMYSIDTPDEVFSNSFTITTKGVFVLLCY